MICLGNIKQYPSSFGPLRESEDQTKWSLINEDGSVDEIDLNKATPEALRNFKIGAAVGEVQYKLANGILVPAAPKAEQNGIEAGNIGKSNEQGKTLALNNGHSILGSDINNMSGFTNRILIALLAGFGMGAICTAVYIFINLGKVTVAFK